MTSNQQEVEHDPMKILFDYCTPSAHADHPARAADAHRADHRPPRARITPLARSTRVAHTLPLRTRG